MYVALMFVASYQSRALGLCIVTALAINYYGADTNALTLISIFFLPALILATFRE